MVVIMFPPYSLLCGCVSVLDLPDLHHLNAKTVILLVKGLTVIQTVIINASTDDLSWSGPATHTPCNLFCYGGEY